MVGWIVEHKNQKVVFEAVANLRDRKLKIPLVLVGPNSHVLAEVTRDRKPALATYVGQIAQFCEDTKLVHGSDYFSLGYIDDLGLECLYQCATMLIVPTLVEAGSFPAIEAMRVGCPVAFSSAPVYREMIDLVDGNAWIFPPHESSALADVIADVAGNWQGARRRAARAQEIVPRIFSWERAAEGYFSVFRRVANAGSTMGKNSAAQVGTAHYPKNSE